VLTCGRSGVKSVLNIFLATQSEMNALAKQQVGWLARIARQFVQNQHPTAEE
jgi:hypothetical protein